MCLNMKAYVQYNDFLGTAAADISDYTTLEKYLNGINVDTNRYHPIGLNFILRMVIIFAMLKFYVKIEKKTTPYQLL